MYNDHQNCWAKLFVKFSHYSPFGGPLQFSTNTLSSPFWLTHFCKAAKIIGIRRLIASMCFLWRIGAIGSVLVASISIFVSKPPFSSVRLNLALFIGSKARRKTHRSKVDLRKRQHCVIGAKIDNSSCSGFPKDFALSSSSTIESGCSANTS